MEVCDHRKYSTTSISTNNFVVGIWVRKFLFWNFGLGSIPTLSGVRFRFYPGFDSDFIRGSTHTVHCTPASSSSVLPGSATTRPQGSGRVITCRYVLSASFVQPSLPASLQFLCISPQGQFHSHCTPASSSSVLTGSATTRPQGSGRVITCRYVLSASFVQPSLPASLQFLCISPQGHKYRSHKVYV